MRSAASASGGSPISGLDPSFRDDHLGEWPEDLADGERIMVPGPGGSQDGITTRVAAGDRFTYRADDGLGREVRFEDGVVVEWVTQP